MINKKKINKKYISLQILYHFSIIIFSLITAIQVDYDLSFPEASYSSAALAVPFRFEGNRQSLTIGMWVQFSHHDEPGIFFTLYNVGSVLHKMKIMAHS